MTNLQNNYKHPNNHSMTTSSKSSIKILVVDDEPDLLQITERLLKKENYVVNTAATGQGCLDAISANKPDLLLLDVKLPDIGGIEICKILKSNPELSSIYVFLISGIEINTENISEGLKLGADGYLIKPIKNRELLARIEVAVRIINTEKALRESEEKFRNIFDLSLVGKSMTMMDGTLKTNKAFSDMLGYSEDELKEIKWQKITHPDDIENDTKIINSIISGEKLNARWEKRYIHKNGGIVWVDISTTLLRDNKGVSLNFITSIIDITERKHVEEALKESETRYRRLVEGAPDIVYTFSNSRGGGLLLTACGTGAGLFSGVFICAPLAMERIHPS
jgi:PAS domain S-box-containing protein